MNKALSSKFFIFLDVILSTAFLFWSITVAPTDFLFGLTITLPINWLTIYFIFYEGPTVGKQLQRLNKYVFPTTRLLLLITVLAGNYLYKNSDFTLAIFDGEDQSIGVLLSMGYHITQSVVLQLSIALLVVSIFQLISKTDLYRDNFDVDKKRYLNKLTLLLPFILMAILVTATWVAQWNGNL